VCSSSPVSVFNSGCSSCPQSSLSGITLGDLLLCPYFTSYKLDLLLAHTVSGCTSISVHPSGKFSSSPGKVFSLGCSSCPQLSSLSGLLLGDLLLCPSFTSSCLVLLLTSSIHPSGIVSSWCSYWSLSSSPLVHVHRSGIVSSSPGTSHK
jgi:hypothetical protein